jgi:hypothetical protein
MCAQIRAEVLQRLGQSPLVVAEEQQARLVQAARRRFDTDRQAARRAVDEAGERARCRAATEVLRQRLTTLPAQGDRAGAKDAYRQARAIRMQEWAARPLEGELGGVAA